MKKSKTIVLTVLIVLFLVVLFQNMSAVTLRLLFWRIEAPKIILIPVTMLLGFVIGFMIAKMTGKGKTAQGKTKP